MKLKPVIIGILFLGALLLWNFREFASLQPDPGRIEQPVIAIEDETPRFNWEWCDEVHVEVKDAVCRIVALPPELEALDGQAVVVAGPSFACGDDLVQHADGYTIKGFIVVPYFGMIDCCIGNPIPYFQWTIVVDQLVTPWEIHHKGIVDPDVVVKGNLRIERGQAFEGIFFLENAEIIDSAEHQLELARAPQQD